jgi:hypothetical protein
MAARLIDCTEGIYYSPMKVSGQIECMWSLTEGFFGWQNEVSGSGDPYGVQLIYLGF